MTLQLRLAARSHQGLLRGNNEDSGYAGPRLVAVADGVGGHAGGEVASAITLATLAPLDEDAPGPDLLKALSDSALLANSHIRETADAEPQLTGMGTTLTAMLFAGARVGLLHVGDSRAYLLRDGELTQITHDHTLVQALVDEGRLTEEEAQNHPQGSVITRALFGEPVELDLSVREVREGDRYLLCSDGLTGPVASLDTLRDAVAIEGLQDAADRLVQLALRGGGPDNVTVLLAEATEQDPGPQDALVVGAASANPQPAPPGIADSAASRARVAEGRDEVPRDVAAQEPAQNSRLGRRTLLAGLGVLVLLLVAAVVGVTYVRSQYYVGVDGQDVAVYRGVTGHVAGLRLSSVETRSDVQLTELADVDQQKVRTGIIASSAHDAMAILTRLQVQAATCTAQRAAPTPSPTGAPTGGALTGGQTPGNETAAPPELPTPTVSSTPFAPGLPSAGVTGVPSPTAAPGSGAADCTS